MMERSDLTQLEGPIRSLRKHGREVLAAKLEALAQTSLPPHVQVACVLIDQAERIAASKPETIEIAARLSEVLYRLRSAA